ncbi:MAG TPA: winged helix-turn-helix domain-containing protein [Steroidobacteraceae bacterium]
MKTARGYALGDLLIDTGMRQVTRAGADLKIVGLSFDLLIALVGAAPDLVSTEQLLRRVWPDLIVTPDTLAQRVKLLRQGLGDTSEDPRYIGSMRGHGYRILAPVKELKEQESAAAASGEPTIMPAQADAAAHTANAALHVFSPGAVNGVRRRWPVVLIVALLITVGSLWWALKYHEKVGAGATKADSRPAAAPSASVAVMPFTNLTGEPGKEYLGDGMAEELINALSQVPGLKVPARTSTFAYKDHATDIHRIAQDLGVAMILEGSVRSAGEHLRISARLVDAPSGFEIWSQEFDRPSADIFKLQDDLAARIVKALRTHLNAQLPAAIRRRAPTQDVQAYQLYLQAQASADGSAEGFLRSITLYDDALVLDPYFARALAGRSDMRMALVAIGHPLPQGLEDAKHDAERALSLDPKLAEANSVLGAIDTLQNDWLQAEIHFRAAIAADPNDGYGRSQYAVFALISTGHVSQAYAQAAEAYRLAPANAFCILVLAIVNSLKGDDEQTVKFADLAIQLGASPRQFAEPYSQVDIRRGRYKEAGLRIAESLSLVAQGDGGAGVMALAYEALGDPVKKPAAREALTQFIRKLGSAALDPFLGPEMMVVLTQLDARDQAFELMTLANDKMVSNGWVLTLWEPAMRSFRQDPRFQPLVRRLDLISYWRRYGPPDGCDLKGDKVSCH